MNKVRIISQEEIKKIEEFEKIGAGACANIYKRGNEVYKLLKENAKGLYRSGSLEKLAGIKNSICIFPNEVLKDEEGYDLGYSMDLVPGKKLKEVFQNLSFEQLQQALENAELGIEQLSEQKIIFDDMHFDNIMWNNEEKSIKIIDTDFFKFAEETSIEKLKKVNLSKFNNEIETLIGIRDGILAKYLGRNTEYTEFYKQRFKRRLMGEQLSPYELIDKIKSTAEKEFGTQFTSISEIIEKAKDKVKEYEELDIENWSEGNQHLRNLLISCRDNNVPSMYCCAGHGKERPAYITIQMNGQTMKKIYNIMNQLKNAKNIGFRFAQKQFGESPSFTIYMNKEQYKNEIMDIISESLTQEQEKDELPENLQMITQISDIFRNEEIGFDLEYDIGKNNNKLLLGNLKFGNSKYLEKSDFNKIGLKAKKDMLGNSYYLINKISNGRENEILENIVNGLNQMYNMEFEEPENLTLSQRIAQKISSNNFMKKIPFMDKFIKKQLYILPEATQKLKSDSASDGRKEFINELSNNGEYRKISEAVPINFEDRENEDLDNEIGEKED